MTTFNLYKYNVVVRWKYDNEYETIVLHSIQEYKSIEELSFMNYNGQRVILGFELIEPTLRKVINENHLNWN
ncbi:MAG: hypothetical protein ACPGSG_02595 [Prolixibacteraceae bacterium]|jgi:SepF-like predicted cell division protein (DUF552 family)